MKSQRYIDDHDYTFAFVRTQINTTDKGPELIKLELKEKGIDKQLIELALKEFSLEQQLEKALKLVKKFLQKNSKDSSKIVKQKLENLLARKGYHYEVINMAFSEIEPVSKQIDELAAIRFQGEKLHRKYSNLTGFEHDQKIKQALFRKGFSFDLIEKYLTQLNGFSEES